MNNNAENISEKILKFRVLAKITQKELSKRLNKPQACVSQWETGYRIPPYDILEKLSIMGKEYNIDFTLEDVFRQKLEQKRSRKK